MVAMLIKTLKIIFNLQIFFKIFALRSCNGLFVLSLNLKELSNIKYDNIYFSFIIIGKLYLIIL